MLGFSKRVINDHLSDELGPYLIRYKFLNIGFHIFFRGDGDENPHDHPFSFWTFPLTPYVEDVYDPNTGVFYVRVVEAFKFHYRDAIFAHRVLGRYTGKDHRHGFDEPQTNNKKIYTIVFFGKRVRDWGFWYGSIWVQWQRYINDNTQTWLD